MKKITILFFLFASFIIYSCGSGNDNGTSGSSGGDITKNPNYQKGLDLISKSDCFTCHKVDGELTGPPYREVANKYGSLPDTIVSFLAKKVISGGTGTWGSIFMTPHPGISQANAETMVKYILLLKK